MSTSVFVKIDHTWVVELYGVIADQIDDLSDYDAFYDVVGDFIKFKTNFINGHMDNQLFTMHTNNRFGLNQTDDSVAMHVLQLIETLWRSIYSYLVTFKKPITKITPFLDMRTVLTGLVVDFP